MSIRWKKVLIVLVPVAVIGFFPLVYERLNPDYFSGIACVRPWDVGDAMLVCSS